MRARSRTRKAHHGDGRAMSDLKVQLWPKQDDALTELDRPEIKILLYGGARGGGKSHLARAYLMLRALQYPGSAHLIVRRSFPELHRTHILRFQQDYGDLLSHQERFHRFTLGNGSTIEYGYAENMMDCNKWQGSEFATIVVDEAQFMEIEILEYFRSINRTRIPGLVCKQLWTANPGGRSHTELRRLFIDRRFKDREKPEGYAFVKALVADNPSLSKEYTEQLEQLPEHLRKAYLEGDWDALLGSFFSFHPHVYEEPYELTESECRTGLYASLDHGVAHATSFGLLYLDEEGRIHRLFSYVNKGISTEDNAKEIFDRVNTFPLTKGAMPLEVFADSSMWAQQRLSDNQTYVSPINVYEKIFPPTVRWIKATREKLWSSQTLKGQLDPKEGEPNYVVWREFSPDWAEWLAQAEIDTRRPETYVKAVGDDVADETRYGSAGLYTKHHDTQRVESAKLKALNARTKRMAKKQDWYTM